MLHNTAVATDAVATENPFIEPPELQRDINFWTKVYTEISSDQGFIHDSRNLDVVYRSVEFRPNIERKARNKIIKGIREEIKRDLLVLANGDRSSLTSSQQKILDLWAEDVSNERLRQATKDIRFQLGQSNNFKAGLIRSGRWLPHIHKTLKSMQLPQQIAALPHVESSFTPNAYSFVGAAGMWQFIRSTGRRFMRIDHIVDERLDPFISTVAAARLLEHNYHTTSSWPLAITAYNHGVAGMRRAAKQTGGTDIVKIVRTYKGRTFKFASRNFYVAFLAALRVSSNAEKYFGPVELEPPEPYHLIKTTHFIAADTAAKHLGTPIDVLKKLNPALRPPVWRNAKYIPKNYDLRIPDNIHTTAAQQLASIPKTLQYRQQLPDLTYTVRRGDSLSRIADKYSIRVRDLIAMNNLRSKHLIRVGQKLRLPQKQGRQSVAIARTLVDGKYTVQRGDTLSLIAKEFDVTENALVAANNLTRRNFLSVNQVLDIEASKPAATTAQITADEKPASKPEADSVNVVTAVTTTETVTTETSPAVIQENTETKPEKVADTKSTETTPADTTDIVAAVTEDTDTKSITENDDTAENIAIALDASNQALAEPVVVDAEEMIADEALESPAIKPDSDIVVLQAEAEAKLEAIKVDTIEIAQPTSQAEAEAIAPAQPPGLHPSLLADPNDYSVGDDDVIAVRAAETLGHYADWLGLRTSKLREINKLKFGKPVIIGKYIKLDFSKVDKEAFVQRRLSYHRNLQETYFAEYQIVDTYEHAIQPGDSIWELTHLKYEIPLWLFLQYNPDINLNNIRPGAKIVLPKVEPKPKIS